LHKKTDVSTTFGPGAKLFGEEKKRRGKAVIYFSTITLIFQHPENLSPPATKEFWSLYAIGAERSRIRKEEIPIIQPNNDCFDSGTSS
jgi:hypothetical protein